MPPSPELGRFPDQSSDLEQEGRRITVAPMYRTGRGNPSYDF